MVAARRKLVLLRVTRSRGRQIAHDQGRVLVVGVEVEGSSPLDVGASMYISEDGGIEEERRLMYVAITRAKDLVTRQRTTLGSHERIGVFRIFGRDSGFTALHTGYVTSGRCVIPEHTFDLDRLAQLMLSDKESNPSRYAFVIAAEGATWTLSSPVRRSRSPRLLPPRR